MFLFQPVPAPPVDLAWLVAGVGTVATALTTTIAVLYRGQIDALKERISWLEAEVARGHAREDKLIEQVGRTADALDRDVSLHERERGVRR
jgi:hypothetical protein